MKSVLPNKEQNPAEWYTSVIKHADLADYGPVKGTMVIKPYGYAIWERIQSKLDDKIKSHNVQNAYFPLFIPMSLIEKEKQHVEGFAPELAVVTHGGGEKLEDPLAVRPTSETIMYHMFSKWIQSHRDLPYMVNQWCNVVRWEKRTHFFTRTSEFLWQEGHTAHATHEDAISTQTWAINAYAEMYRDELAMYGYVGHKSASERFAGANDTLTYESLMPSGKTLQSSTSHDLGQNFARSFDITFSDDTGENQHVWQTSWGFSTRSMGGLIMAHGDENGLRLPPHIAPYQVVIIGFEDKGVQEASKELQKSLLKHGLRVHIDTNYHSSFGRRINEWELKGAPIRIELGKRELESRKVTIARRDNLSKETVAMTRATNYIDKLLGAIQQAMLQRTKDFNEERTYEASDYKEFTDIANSKQGFIKVYWNDNPELEAKIKEETLYKSSCKIEEADEANTDFMTGEPTKDIWLFAQSY